MSTFDDINRKLLSSVHATLLSWLPQGRIEGNEFVSINPKRADKTFGSFKINIHTGLWSDFASKDSGGDLISLYAFLNNLSQGDALKQLANGEYHEKEAPTKSVTKVIKDQWEPLVIAEFNLKILPHPLGKPSVVYEYKTQDGQLIGAICRFETDNGKEIFPLSWCQKGDKKSWQWRAFKKPRPLYHLELLKENKPILLVEGEKSCDAAQLLLPDYTCMTWPGGANSLRNADFSVLKDRKVTIWPDADDAGIKAAKQIKKLLPKSHIVELPQGLSEGWDLADFKGEFVLEDYLKPKQVAIFENKQQRSQVMFPHRDQKNKLLATLDNLRILLEHYRIICRYNVISKRILHIIPNEEFSMENEEEAALACIYSSMKEWQLPVDGYKMFLLRIADENQHNPVLEWIKSKPWDGVSRLQQLYDTIESPEKEAKELLIRRWLITAICMASGEGVDSAGCLVLQGAQDLGKTWWVKMLVPEAVRKQFVRTDANVNPADKDSVSQIISYWIVELGEIGATFRKADLDALKAFITRDHDTMRRPYGEGDKRYARRTALVASVDQSIYLHDTAGNRRFWTIPCDSINSYHNIDMQQLWSEVLDLVENKEESWQLEPDEKAHIARINEEHMQIDPIYELLRDKYYWQTENQNYKSATTIGMELNLKNVTQKETRLITTYAIKLGAIKEIGGQKRLKIPYTRS